MSAINFNYNSDLIYSELVDNTIVLKNKGNNEPIYKLPIPKNFQISGINYEWGDNRPNYVITPYKLEKPKYIPKGYKNLRLADYGLWYATNDQGTEIAYIDTSLLSEQDFEYPTLGKNKVTKNEIPEPFWIPRYNDLPDGWRKKEEIERYIKKFDEKARLLHEEELLSIFALNDLGLEFWDLLPQGIYENSFCRDLEKYCLCCNEMCMDNWDIVVATRANRQVYRLISRQKTRINYECFWYKDTAFIYTDDKKSPFHIFPVLDSKSKEERVYKKSKQ